MELALSIGFAALMSCGVLMFATLRVSGECSRIEEERDWQKQDDFYHIALSEIPEQGQWQEPTRSPKPDDEFIECQMSNGEHFLFIYNEQTRCDMMRHLGDCAANPLHPLTWYDVAKMTLMMRENAIARQWDNAKHGPSQDG